ncbi:MAG: tetratricopeptide repeat protein [Candidatus Saccharimonadia bacterium]
MSKSRQSKHPKAKTMLRWGVGLIIIVVIFSPLVIYLANNRAVSLVLSAKQALKTGDIDQELLDYQIASWLAPRNQQIIQLLASAYASAKRPDDAIKTLERLPNGGGGSEIISLTLATGQLKLGETLAKQITKSSPSASNWLARSKIELESGDTIQSLSSIKSALAMDPNNQASQIQLGILYAVVNNNDLLTKLISSVSSVEVLRDLDQIKTGKIPLAYFLNSQGLLRSSRTILLSQTNLGARDQYLLGEIDFVLSPNDSSKLAESESYLIKSTHQDPSYLPTHSLLYTLYQKEGNSDQAQLQLDQIKALTTGKV